MLEEAVILEGARTPFGNFAGSLKDISATDLGTIACKATLEKSGIEAETVEDLIFGNVLPSGKDSAYIARHIALDSGLKVETPALTVNRLCGSGMESIILAAQKIKLQENTLILSGGTESMSQVPYVLRGARNGYRYGNADLEDLLSQGLTDTYTGLAMGLTAENLAEKYSISREEQDEWAAISQERAEEATLEGRLGEEITPVEIRGKSIQLFDKDEFIRGKESIPRLGTLKPAFKKDGTVTAGNSSGINDGACALLISSQTYAEKNNLIPLAMIRGYGHSGCAPEIMGIGPVFAIPKALKQAGLTLSDMHLIEINEAFAAQFLAVKKELGLDESITNVNGGAIAIGHPLAASGARITLSLAYELRRRKLKYGLASLCIGGGQGIAIVLENPNL
ncbi:MAG: acetyl-CoA C-acetyltransferase [Leptospiraceae bacterium]|nr:acetyl-CoA C-acetyltransferase [Leptospiraceae bacterium]